MPKREIIVSVAAQPAARLDVYLSGQIEGMSRAAARKLIDGGGVLVNGKKGKAGARLKEGDRIDVDLDLQEVQAAAPASGEIVFDVVYEDGDILVIDKPSGVVVHPGAGNRRGTLADALVLRYPEIRDVGDPGRPGIVHRLDKETSGLMVVARTRTAYESLVSQFKSREVRKTYLGLVWGLVSAPEGRLDWPIGRHPKQRQRISIKTHAPREAITTFKVLERLKDCSLLEIRPLTGRTHQIRVHLAAAGHPLVGDTKYGRKRPAKPGKTGIPPRLMLHAHKLSFLHPATGARVEFVSPGAAQVFRSIK